MLRAGRGFTLIEVLVALAIAAIALAAISRAAVQSTGNSSALIEHQLAAWMADDHLTRLRISGEWPNTATTEGTRQFAGREYRWQQVVLATPDPDLRRVEVTVHQAASQRSSVRLAAYVRNRLRGAR
jgi:general secretion pathway protein I